MVWSKSRGSKFLASRRRTDSTSGPQRSRSPGRHVRRRRSPAGSPITRSSPGTAIITPSRSSTGLAYGSRVERCGSGSPTTTPQARSTWFSSCWPALRGNRSDADQQHAAEREQDPAELGGRHAFVEHQPGEEHGRNGIERGENRDDAQQPDGGRDRKKHIRTDVEPADREQRREILSLKLDVRSENQGEHDQAAHTSCPDGEDAEERIRPAGIADGHEE